MVSINPQDIGYIRPYEPDLQTIEAMQVRVIAHAFSLNFRRVDKPHCTTKKLE
jgi:hypothetical protein